jgi:hypothetical protein
MRSRNDKVIFVNVDGKLLTAALKVVGRRSVRALPLIALAHGYSKYAGLGNIEPRTYMAWTIASGWMAGYAIIAEYWKLSKHKSSLINIDVNVARERDVSDEFSAETYFSCSFFHRSA